MPEPLVIYHAHCNDGLCAALVARAHLGGAGDYVSCQYGDAPPETAGRDVYVLDFSFPRAALLDMQGRAASLIVLDHHKTAEADLSGLDFCRFDMNKSGGRMTREWFAARDGRDAGGPGAEWLVDYTEDRDLWRWRLPDSREVSAALASYPQTLEAWEPFMSWPEPGPLAAGGPSCDTSNGSSNPSPPTPPRSSWTGTGSCRSTPVR
jgi:hypothetical protein